MNGDHPANITRLLKHLQLCLLQNREAWEAAPEKKVLIASSILMLVKQLPVYVQNEIDRFMANSQRLTDLKTLEVCDFLQELTTLLDLNRNQHQTGMFTDDYWITNTVKTNDKLLNFDEYVQQHAVRPSVSQTEAGKEEPNDELDELDGIDGIDSHQLGLLITGSSNHLLDDISLGVFPQV